MISKYFLITLAITQCFSIPHRNRYDSSEEEDYIRSRIANRRSNANRRVYYEPEDTYQENTNQKTGIDDAVGGISYNQNRQKFTDRPVAEPVQNNDKPIGEPIDDINKPKPILDETEIGSTNGGNKPKPIDQSGGSNNRPRPVVDQTGGGGSYYPENNRPRPVPVNPRPYKPAHYDIENVNQGVGTILNGVGSGKLSEILRGSFLFTQNERVRSVANSVLDSIFGRRDPAVAGNSQNRQGFLYGL